MHLIVVNKSITTSALPTYALSVYKAPALVIKKIVALQQQFLWGGKRDVRKLVWAKWAKLALPKVAGGLGVRDLSCFNKALLGKWAWRALLGREELWLQIIGSSQNGRLEGNMRDMSRRSGTVPGWWGDVLSSLSDEKGNWFDNNLCRFVGNGENTSFWHDAWAGPENLKSMFPRFFNRCREPACSVARAGEWVGNIWTWKVPWRRDFRESELPDLNRLISLLESRKSFSNINDSWRWTIEKDGAYSVRSSYNSLIDRKLEPNLGLTKVGNLLWRNVAVAKAKALAWRVLFCKVATKSDLRRRGVLPLNAVIECPCCGNQEETTEHLFFQCGVTTALWSGCLDWIGVQAPLSSSATDNLLQFCFLMDTKERRKFLASLWVCVVWSIWKERNNLIFKNGKWRNDRILGDIKSFMWVWVKSSSVIHSPLISFKEWNGNPW